MKFNWYVVFLALLFGYVSNDYFGWNWKPQSEAEVICDGLVLLLLALSSSRRDHGSSNS